MRLIDADELIQTVSSHSKTEFEIKNCCITMENVIYYISNAPTVNKCNNCDLMLLEKTKDKDYDQYMKGHKDGYKQAIIDGKLEVKKND